MGGEIVEATEITCTTPPSLLFELLVRTFWQTGRSATREESEARGETTRLLVRGLVNVNVNYNRWLSLFGVACGIWRARWR